MTRYFKLKLIALKDLVKNHKCQLILFSLVHAVILPLLFQTIYQTSFSDIGVFFNYATRVVNDILPYRDFTMEYPPFALFFFVLPRLFTADAGIYRVAFQIEIFLFVLLGLYIIYRIARCLEKAPWKMMAVYTAAIVSVGPIVAQSYDIFPAIMVLLALYLFWRGKHKLSWMVLALAAMTKIYPVFIAPLFLISYLRNRQYKRIWSGILVFTATSLATLIPFLVTGPDNLLNFFNYHAQRSIQIETTYSSFLLFIGVHGAYQPEMAFGAGSWNITGPLADTLSSASTFVLAGLLLLSYGFIYTRLRAGESRIFELGTCSLFIIAVTLMTSKVLSPQYLIWLLPLLPLTAGRPRFVMYPVFIILGALTYYIFPLHYTDLITLESKEVSILLARNISLIVVTVLTGVSLYRLKYYRRRPDPKMNEVAK